MLFLVFIFFFKSTKLVRILILKAYHWIFVSYIVDYQNYFSSFISQSLAGIYIYHMVQKFLKIYPNILKRLSIAGLQT